MQDRAVSDALFEAIDDADVEAVDTLIRADASLAAARDDAGVSSVRHALYRGHHEIAERLATQVALDEFDLAALGRAMELHTLLEGEPAAARSVSEDGFTPLHFAAFLGGPETITVLVDAGADVGAVSTGAMTVQPLHSAAASGSVEAVRALLDSGADADARQGGGFTPLHEAALNGNVEMATLLVERGADATLTADDGRSAVEMARQGGHSELAQRLA